jgi:hypothetical protein
VLVASLSKEPHTSRELESSARTHHSKYVTLIVSTGVCGLEVSVLSDIASVVRNFGKILAPRTEMFANLVSYIDLSLLHITDI